MSQIVLSPAYFGPIDLFANLVGAEKLVWEKQDNYQKQTYRTRQYIYGPNGKLLLNIPIVHPKDPGQAKQAYAEVEIDRSENWQIIHWRSIEAAYRSSPFFEFYEDELHFLYHQEFTNLYDFNKKCFQVIMDCLNLEVETSETEVYHKTYSDLKDGRNLIVAKRKPSLTLPRYDQVFQEKHGFIPNLSILDLLFNLGPESAAYLKDIGN